MKKFGGRGVIDPAGPKASKFQSSLDQSFSMVSFFMLIYCFENDLYLYQVDASVCASWCLIKDFYYHEEFDVSFCSSVFENTVAYLENKGKNNLVMIGSRNAVYSKETPCSIEVYLSHEIAATFCHFEKVDIVDKIRWFHIYNLLADLYFVSLMSSCSFILWLNAKS